ncbi:MAG: gluconate 2-dehydrogenase subunit 3 family protein [Nitrososphaerales archaeon]
MEEEKRVEAMREAMDAQQAALAAQTRAAQASTDAYLAAQQEAKEASKERSETAASESRRGFLKMGGMVLVGAAVGVALGSAESSAVAVPVASGVITSLKNQYNSVVIAANGQITSLQSQISSLNGQIADLQASLDTTRGFITLSVTEQSLVEAIGEALIPSDSSGPGFQEAGGVYFIDRQLATDYGKSADMYMRGPFVMPNTAGPITVDGVTYAGGTMPVTIVSGMQYQYRMELREFWRYGLQAFETYCNSAYGGNFETLTPLDRIKALTDLYNNTPTSFNGIIPVDFFNEVFTLVWSGFLMDPLYGGNKGMVGWTYTGFNGVNTGDFYGEGQTDQQLMVATTATRLQPASLAQYQKGSP